MELKFDNYIRLNDLGESLLCCDNVLSVSRGMQYGGEHHHISVLHAYTREPTIFIYDNIDTLMPDFENIKNRISSSTTYKS